MTNRHRRIAALEGQMHHHQLDEAELDRIACEVAAEEGADPAEILADLRDLADRTRGMAPDALAETLAAEAGISVEQLEAEAIAIARRHGPAFGGVTR